MERYELRQWQEQSDTVSDSLDDFMDFVGNTDSVELGLFKNRDEEDLFFVNLRKLVDKFLLDDEESQTKIKRAEQELLKKWKGE